MIQLQVAIAAPMIMIMTKNDKDKERQSTQIRIMLIVMVMTMLIAQRAIERDLHPGTCKQSPPPCDKTQLPIPKISQIK